MVERKETAVSLARWTSGESGCGRGCSSGVAFATTGLSLIAYAFHFGFFESLERQSIDMRFSMRGSQGAAEGHRRS